ncbi:MAG: BlaI/MecI/CopY family transcriptional regulator [Pirellulales bacterium]
MDKKHDHDRPPGLSDSELVVLKALWDLGAGTVREVNAELAHRGRRWAYTTVQTLMVRLQQKGCVESTKEDVAHTYRPTVSREQLLQQRLSELETDLCGGTATPLVHALVTGKRFTTEEIAHFRRLLDELEADDYAAKRSTKTGIRKPKR